MATIERTLTVPVEVHVIVDDITFNAPYETGVLGDNLEQAVLRMSVGGNVAMIYEGKLYLIHGVELFHAIQEAEQGEDEG